MFITRSFYLGSATRAIARIVECILGADAAIDLNKTADSRTIAPADTRSLAPGQCTVKTR